MAMNIGDGLALASIVLIGVISCVNFILGYKTYIQSRTIPAPKDESVAQKAPAVKEVPKSNWENKVFQGLTRSRQNIFQKIMDKFIGAKPDSALWEGIEEVLYTADLGPKIVQQGLEIIKQQYSSGLDDEQQKKKVLSALYHFFYQKLHLIQNEKTQDHLLQGDQTKPQVIMVVGVNGAGKTTTIGKLAMKYSLAGKSVTIAACDTFRAAAVQQLKTWADLSKSQFVCAQKEGADASGVAYEAIEKAKKSQSDICIIDTAGRLHTKTNLMEELAKIKRVMGKVIPSAPHHSVLVIDAVVGQNALLQAREFHKTLALNSLIVTKCDSSSKAGSVIAISDELQLPVAYIGVGEEVDDLNPFDLKLFLLNLLGLKEQDV